MAFNDEGGALSEHLSQLEQLTQIIRDVLSKETLTELYELILDQTVTYFGFDYGAISRVDYKTRRIKTERGKSAMPHLINPDDWQAESDYSLNDTDILVSIIKEKKTTTISGPEVERNWDPRLNRQIYEKYNHKELVRLYVPFVLHQHRRLGDKEGAEERVIGVIEAGYHMSKRTWISESQRALFELFINYCSGAFQKLILVEERKAFDKILEKLNPQDSLLSSSEEIYAALREAVEEYLKVDTVSIWEKSTAGTPVTLRLVAASERLSKQYAENDIWELPHNSLIAEAIKSRDIIEFIPDGLREQRVVYPTAEANDAHASMIIIPISIGPEAYAVVAVFFDPSRSFTAEEKDFLEHFAQRAAVAMISIQHTKSINSFSLISESLLDEDIYVTLQRITDSALEVLHADPVILFRFENNSFLPWVIRSGHLFFPEIEEVTFVVNETELVNLLLKGDASNYFENEQDYQAFLRRNNRTWRSERFKEDFWHREKLQSSVALRLDYRNECLGVMFVNYRTKQVFNAATRKLIEAFALQAASAIANARLMEQKKAFWELQRRDSLSLSLSDIITGLAHNSGNLLSTINALFASLEIHLKKTEGKWLEREKIDRLVANMREPLTELAVDFERIHSYRRAEEFAEERCQTEEVIERALSILRHRFEINKITVKTAFSLTPPIFCDRNQVEHLLLNLFINALDAMGRRGVLSVATELCNDGNFIRIRITDNGIGIPSELYSQIFLPYFTTKKQGTGVGLSVSRYIAEEHGGRIDFTSKQGKGTSFFIYLPVRKMENSV